jgi:uncharacterized protein (DUF1778 family)
MSDSTPVCFRVPPEERRLLTVVASYQGQNLSAFVRSCTMAVAREIVDRVGMDTILREFQDMTNAQQAKQDKGVELIDELISRSAEDRDSGTARDRTSKTRG